MLQGFRPSVTAWYNPVMAVDANRFEDDARARKINKILPAMRRLGITAAKAETMTEGQWIVLAHRCGSKIPSETTRGRITRILMTEIDHTRITQ